MSTVKKFYPEVRLRKMMNDPEGIRASEALDRAAIELEEIRDKCLAAIDAKVERIAELAAVDAAACYELSNEVFAEAGTFGLVELSTVAHSLCVLLSGQSRVPAAVVRVHVDAMRALRRPAIAGNKVLRATVLNELGVLTARFATN